MHDPSFWERQVWNRQITVPAGVRSRAIEINLPELESYTLAWHVEGSSTECALVHVTSRASTVQMPRTFVAGLHGGNSTTCWGAQSVEIEASNYQAGQTIVTLWISPATPAGEAGQITRDPFTVTQPISDDGAGGPGSWVVVTGTAPSFVSPYQGWAPWGCPGLHMLNGNLGAIDISIRFRALAAIGPGATVGTFLVGLDTVRGILRGERVLHPPHTFLEARNPGGGPATINLTCTWTRGI